MSLQLHRPDGEGGLEQVPPADSDWRGQLRSPRWGTALAGDRLPELKNPEMNPTSRLRSVLFWLSLGLATFLILVVAYGIGFWTLPPKAEPTPAPAIVRESDATAALRPTILVREART